LGDDRTSDEQFHAHLLTDACITGNLTCYAPYKRNVITDNDGCGSIHAPGFFLKSHKVATVMVVGKKNSPERGDQDGEFHLKR